MALSTNDIDRLTKALSEKERSGLFEVFRQHMESKNYGGEGFKGWVKGQSDYSAQGLTSQASFRQMMRKHRDAINKATAGMGNTQEYETETPGVAGPEMPAANMSYGGILKQFGMNKNLQTATENLNGLMQHQQTNALSNSATAQGMMNASKMLKETGLSNIGGMDVGGAMDDAALVGRAAEMDPIAIAQLTKKVIDQKVADFKGIGQEGMAAFKSESPFAAAGHGMRSAAHAADLAGIPGAGTALKFGAALVESVDKIKEFTNSLHDANMSFAQYSGSMSAVQAQAEAQDFYRKQAQGEARSASAGRLAGARNKLENATAPIEDAWANIRNDLTAMFVEAIVPVVESMKVIIDLLPKFGDDKDEPNDLNRIMVEATMEQQQKELREYGRQQNIRNQGRLSKALGGDAAVYDAILKAKNKK